MMNRTGRLLALAACAALLSSCDGGASRTADWYVVPGREAAGTVVPIRIEHSLDCEQIDTIDVDEQSDTVRITVRLSDLSEPGAECADVAAITDVDVQLDAPLDERRLEGPGYQP